MRKKEIWVDYLRAFACILVFMGHLFMSLQEAGIMDTQLISYGIEIIYRFHVYIFFFASGYLMQTSAQQYTDQSQFMKKKLIRSLDFLIVYVLFSAVTYGIKIMLSGDVNSPIGRTFPEILLKYPINQMWYLYAIFLITLCAPVPRSERGLKLVLFASIALKVIMCIPDLSKMVPMPLDYLFDDLIWYTMGMLWMHKPITLNIQSTALFTVIFLTVSTAAFFLQIDNDFLDALLTANGLVVSANWSQLLTRNQTKMPCAWMIISKYMLQIYLLHTITAAGIRIILMRAGITNFWLHLPIGIIFSFVPPVVCGAIAEHIPLLNIIFYPSKTIKELFRL